MPEDYSFIEKTEVEDSETKAHYWVYKCKYCHSELLNASVNLLAFISDYEESLKEKKA